MGDRDELVTTIKEKLWINPQRNHVAQLSFENIAEVVSSTSFADLLSKPKMNFSDNTIEVCSKLYLKPNTFLSSYGWNHRSNCFNKFTWRNK